MPTKEFIENLANGLVEELKPFCKKIKIVGSILRRENVVHRDIDIVLIPKDRIKLEDFMKTKGKFIEDGERESTWKVARVKIELYYTIPEEWGAEVLAYSLEKGHAIGLRKLAKEKGFKLNNHGLWKGDKKIASKSEKEIFKKLCVKKVAWG